MASLKINFVKRGAFIFIVRNILVQLAGKFEKESCKPLIKFPKKSSVVGLDQSAAIHFSLNLLRRREGSKEAQISRFLYHSTSFNSTSTHRHTDIFG